MNEPLQTTTNVAKPENNKPLSSVEEEKLMMLLSQVDANPGNITLSEKQISQFLKDRATVYGYMHAENMADKDLEKVSSKHRVYIYLIIAFLVFAIFVIVAIANKDILGKLLEYIFVFLGGTSVGAIGGSAATAKIIKRSEDKD